MTNAPFVSEVLLYDRLVIPVPDDKDKSKEYEEFWSKNDPALQKECLNILKVKTPLDDGLALKVIWDKSKRDRFVNKMSTASAVATQQRDPNATYYVDRFNKDNPTPSLIQKEFLPEKPKGVSKVWALAAYRSAGEFAGEHEVVDVSDSDSRRQRLAVLIKHRFLTPTKSDPKHALLKKAVDLVTKNEFRKKRATLYEWIDEIIEQKIDDQKAIDEMEKMLAAYNNAIEDAFDEVDQRFVYTLLPIGVAVLGSLAAGALGGAMLIPLLVAGATGAVQLGRFWRFDSKPKIDAGDADGAAMIYNGQKALLLGDSQA